MEKILTADIGGTNGRFAFFTVAEEGTVKLEESRWLKTGEADSFSRLIDLLDESPFPLRPEEADVTVIAVAGPVQGGTFSDPPNIPWTIDLSSEAVRGRLRRAFLINDFIAQAFATRSPVVSSAEEILSGRVVEDAAAAVIGAGTGLGHAALVPDRRGGYTAVPSEKGHAAFPMVTSREQGFQTFLTDRLGETYCRGDTVVSGRGLALLHLFLTGEEFSPEDIAARLTPASETAAWFARFYGRACRDYALTVLARGGVYLAGGVAARMPDLVRHKAFAAEFRNSPTMADLLRAIPVFLILDQESGLWGAARYGLQCLRKG